MSSVIHSTNGQNPQVRQDWEFALAKAFERYGTIETYFKNGEPAARFDIIMQQYEKIINDPAKLEEAKIDPGVIARIANDDTIIADRKNGLPSNNCRALLKEKTTLEEIVKLAKETRRYLPAEWQMGTRSR